MAKRSLRKVPLGSSSVSSHIQSTKRYRIRVDDAWYEGSFSKRWFGWNFDDYGTDGIQLNMIDEVFEIVLSRDGSAKAKK